MSLLIQGMCVEDSLQAKVKADSMFPYIFSGGTATAVPQFVYLTASSINTSTGVYTYSTKNQAGTVLNTNSTITFQACNDSDLTFSPSNMIFGACLIFAFLIAFGHGLKR